MLQIVVRRVAAGVVVLTALATATGLAMWDRPAGALRTVTVGQGPVAVAVDAHSAHVFVVNYADGGHRGSVSMLDAATGAVIRTIAVGMLPVAVAVDTRHARALVVNRGSHTVSVLDTRSGRVVGTVAVAAVPVAVAVLQDPGRAVVASVLGTTSVLDTATGTLVRTIGIRRAEAVAADEHLGYAIIAAAVGRARGRASWIPAKSGGRASAASRISALDTRTGRVRYSLELHAAVLALAVDGRRGRAFALTDAGSVRVLDTRSGRTLRAIPVDRQAEAVAVDEATGHVFVLRSGNTDGDSNSVSAFDPATGHVLSIVPLGYGGGQMSVDARHGRVYVTNSNADTVSILDTHTGQLLRTIPIVHGPGAVAVSEGTDRVFVASSDTSNGMYSGMPGPKQQLLPRLLDALRYDARLVRRGRLGTITVLDAAQTGS